MAADAEISARLELPIATILILAFAALAVLLAPWRELPGYGTETDFIGSMVPEAKRLLSGEPLTSDFHPPGFALVLSGVFGLVGDWFTAGKAIAIVSALLTMIVSLALFRGLFGPWSGLGAVLALLSSSVFISYALSATSDVFFLFLFTLAFLLAHLAATRRKAGLWLACGLVIGMTMMTRTNGITNVFLILVPLVQSGRGYRLGAIASGAIGVSVVLALFFALASVTGSSLWPGGTHHNLAMTYFTEERIAWEGIAEARTRFDSLGEVLLHDPPALIRRYLTDLYATALTRLPFLAGSFLALLFVPGLIFQMFEPERPVLRALLVVVLIQILFLNFKAFEGRYFLFVVPWIGAAAFVLIRKIAAQPLGPVALPTAIGVFFAMAVAGASIGIAKTVAFASRTNTELAVIVPALRGLVDTDDVVVARKPHVAFLLDAERQMIPVARTPDDLRTALAGLETAGTGDIHVLISGQERRYRPDLVLALETGPLPDWLTRVAGSEVGAPVSWTLYRYEP